jgi:hypothetical protein
VKPFFVVIGVIVVFLFLANNSVLTGQVCLKSLGCISSGSTGLHVDSSKASSPSGP